MQNQTGQVHYWRCYLRSLSCPPYPELKRSSVMRKNEVTYHKLKEIDTDMFALDLADININGDDLDGIINKIKTKQKQTPDKHAPEVTKKITERKMQPWFDDNIKNLKRCIWRREKVRRKHKCSHQWRAFKDAQCT